MTAVEGYTLRQQPLAALRGPSPLLRLASDERLIALTRSGQQAAFEALVARYQQRLLAFCRHMLRSREDAEDVLQEVFAAAFNAIMADSREINARPWLYRIARNRSLNHLRRTTAIGVDSMDAHFADAGQSTSEKAHGREEFRLLVEDIGHLPESQRSALVLREMDALSYEQIADVMDTTVPSVKSLLVRARIGLAEAAEARKLTCEEVRFELGETAEGLRSISAPVRRHVKQCDRCRAFRTQLRSNNRALAAIMPIGPLLLLKKTLLVKLGLAKLWAGGAGASGGAATASAGGAAGATGSAVAVTGGGFGGIAAGAVAVKAVVVVAAATIVAVGTTKIFHHAPTARPPTNTPALSASAPATVVSAVTFHHRPFSLTTINSPAHARRAQSRLHLATPPPPYLRRFAAAGGTSSISELGATAPVAIAPPSATPEGAPAATVPTDTVTQTTSAAPTPTTQEISTTTVFPSSTAGAGATAAGGATATTGTTGTTATGETITTVTSLTGATGTTATGTTTTTGSTAGAGSVASTGASGSGGSTANASSASASGATGPAGS